MSTPLHSIVLVLFASFLGSFGAVFLKGGAIRLKRPIFSVIYNWRLAAGVIAFLLSSIFFIKGIKDGELTVLYPMASAGYIWTLFWSRLFFGEPLTRYKFMGLALIVVGNVCLGMSGR